MLFQEVINQHKKHMARVIFTKTGLEALKQFYFLIVESVNLSSGETVPTRCRPCQNKILTTVVTVTNQEKRIQTKMKVLQLTNKNTSKTSGSNLLKLIRRHRKLVESKLGECYEIKLIVQELKMGKIKKKMSLKIRVWVFKKSWASTRKWSKNLKTWKKKLREQEARETRAKGDKARLEIKTII